MTGLIIKTSKDGSIFNKPLIHVLTIIFVVLVIYSNTLKAPFQFDDAPNIVENPAIRDLQYFSDPALVKGTNSGRINEAIQEYQAAVELSPDYAQAHNNLALAYIDQGRTDDAIKEFQILLEIRPDDYPMASKFLEFLLRK